MLSADERPYDRPMSKDYLAGNAPEEWLPLRPTEFYPEHEMCSPSAPRAVALAGRPAKYSSPTEPGRRAAAAPGAEPIRLGIPGAEFPQSTPAQRKRLPPLIAAARAARRTA